VNELKAFDLAAVAVKALVKQKKERQAQVTNVDKMHGGSSPLPPHGAKADPEISTIKQGVS